MSMRYPGGLIAPTPVNQQYPSGVWTGAQTTPYQTNNVWANDSSFKSTTMLLHGDGATTPFIKDASTNNFQITLNGDTKPNNLTPFITNGYWSNVFDGTGDYLNLSDNAAFQFGSGDFTYECWVYPTKAYGATVSQGLISYGVPGAFNNTYTVNLQLNPTTGYAELNVGYTVIVTGTSQVPLNQWSHIVGCRTSGVTSIFVNGTRQATSSTAVTLTTSAGAILRLGGQWFADAADRQLGGYLSNARVIKGSGPYNASSTTITVPTTPLTAITNTSLLTCQSNRFVDNSTNAFAITVAGNTAVSMQQPFTAPSGTSLFGSGYFDGTGDAIYSASQATTFGTGDFTLEFWVYFSAVNNSTVKYLYDMRNSGATTASFLAQEASNAWTFWNGAGSTLTTGFTSSTFAATTWNHVAICRSSGVTKFFVNGTQTGSVADTSNYANSTLTVGTRYTFSDGLNGYISNLRIVNGTAVYTAAFTPSTTPLTAVTNTSLLTLQTNGPANNNGFLDSSPNSFVITRNGNTTQGSFTPYEANGYWSVNFTGAQTSPSLTYPSISAYDLGATSQWTYECWVYFASLSGEQSIFERWSGTGGPGWLLTKLSSNAYRAHFGSSVYIDTGAIAVANQWIHLAVSRDGSTGSLFVDGVRQATTGSVANFSDGTDPLVFGERNSGSQTFPFNGYISNARIVKGTYVYNPSSTSVTVPTAPLTAITNTVFLGLQSNRYIDNSSNNATATASSASSVQAFQPFAPTVQYTPSTLGGSGYFDGSGDYLSVANNGLFGAGNWTFECWVNAPVGQTDKSIIDARNSASGAGTTTGFTVTMITSTEIRLWSGSERIRATANYVNQWLHIAVVKNSTTTTMYFNGASVGTTTALGDMSDTSFLVAAGYYGSTSIGAYGNFYASNMRVVKGTAVYTANFTPPTAPVTAITNTVLLMNYTNAAIFDNSGMNNLETVGNAQIDTSVVKYGTSSMYFDGTGDYLLLQGGQNFTFGTGDFTIEMWIYVVSGLSADIVYYDGRPTSTNGLYNIIYTNSTGKLVYSTNSADRITSTTTLSTTTWYHIALSRSGTNTKLFLNGTQEGSTYTDSNSYIVGANRPVIGGNGYTLGNAPLNGYMDDLRITKGVARYITNFTPPVARMPNQ